MSIENDLKRDLKKVTEKWIAVDKELAAAEKKIDKLEKDNRELLHENLRLAAQVKTMKSTLDGLQDMVRKSKGR